jgi:hypothetical protein
MWTLPPGYIWHYRVAATELAFWWEPDWLCPRLCETCWQVGQRFANAVSAGMLDMHLPVLEALLFLF